MLSRAKRLVRKPFPYVVFLFLVFTAYSLIVEPNFMLTTTFYAFPLGKNVTIVFVSDFHLGTFHLPQRDKLLVEKLREISPDLILVGGDIASSRYSLEEAKDLLLELSTISKVVAVYGNWDYYSKVASKRFAKELAGRVTFLKNSFWEGFNHSVCIYGIDYLDPLPPQGWNSSCKMRISLIHTPEHIEYVENSSQLILAGHTHGGQIRLPLLGALILPVEEEYKKFDYGMFELETGARLIVTRGIGCSLVPVRLLCPPEIAVIKI